MNARSKKNDTSSWNSGIWKKKYSRLAKGGPVAEGNTTAVYRAKHVLTMRENHGRSMTVTEPTKGVGFFPFEEDLPHHIREALVICSTGISTSFFDNPYVKSLLQGLNPQHRPVYRMKLAKIILVIHEVLTTEVSVCFELLALIVLVPSLNIYFLFQIQLIVTDQFLQYTECFIASTSDFWWHPVWQQSYAATIANMMAKGYTMKTGMFLAMSNTTHKKVLKESPGILRSVKPTVHRLQALMDFCKWSLPKTGGNIGIWLDIAHKLVGIEPSYVGSHVVDGAGNAKSSVDELKWRTSESTPRNITADPCNVHSVSTSSQMASGTSKHVKNLNSDCGTALKLLHGWIVRLSNTTAVSKILKDARDEKLRVKYPRIWKGMTTRWRSWFLECYAANANQHDLETTFYRTAQPGVIEKIREGEVVELPTNVPTDSDWELYQQYEGAFRPLDSLVLFMQNAEVVVHEELFHIRATMELLASPWFLMYENISKFDGPMLAKDLTVSMLCFIFLQT